MGRNIHLAPVDLKMTVAHQMPPLGTGASQTQTVNDVVQAAFQKLQQDLAGHSLATVRLPEIAAELPFQDPINTPRFLFLAQLQPVLRNLLAPLSVLPGGIGVACYGAFISIAAVSFKVKLDFFPAAQPANRSSVSCHNRTAGTSLGDVLYPAPLRRAATVVGNRSNILDHVHFKPGGLQGTDCRLPAGARPLH